MPRGLTFALVACAAVLAGCGNSRTPAPSLTQPAAPEGFRVLSYPEAGVRFQAPRNWLVSEQRAPLIATVTSGTATVALWRYIRPKPPSAAARATLREQLHAARAALVSSAKAHAPRLRLIRARTTRLAGLPAVVLDATERIAGNRRRVRSLHLFAPRIEVVIEEYAPPGIFHAVDRAVFWPLKRSLALILAPRA